MQVFLIHGMGRTRASMALLARRLSRTGFRPSTFGYHAWRDPLETIAERFGAFVDGKRHRADAPYAVIGHSLGNVITRLASPRLPPGFRRFAMLAPPNQSPALARAMRRSPTFRAFTGDAGHKLARRDYMAALPRPDVPTLILAGDRNLPWMPFRGAPSDGIVGVAETRLEGVPHRVFATSHTFIMNDADVVEALIRFLRHGRLDD